MESAAGKQAVKEFFIQIRKSFSETVSFILFYYFIGNINSHLDKSYSSWNLGKDELLTNNSQHNRLTFVDTKFYPMGVHAETILFSF